MSNKAIIKNGIVVNIGIASPNDKPSANVVDIPAGQKVEIGYSYSGGKFTEPVKQGATIEDLRQTRLSMLNSNLQRYVYSKYDIGTQASFQALYLLPVSQTSKDAIASVWSWVQSVLIYYYNCKTEITAFKTAKEITDYKWDFSQFTAPEVSLNDILKELM